MTRLRLLPVVAALMVLLASGRAGAQAVPTEQQQLSLQSDRFLVLLELTDPGNGGRRLAPAVRLSDQSGYFWFFDNANVEVTAKILDGRALNNHYWLFVASMTNIPFTVIVVDQSFVCLTTPCPNEKRYVSPAGQNRNFIDLDLF